MNKTGGIALGIAIVVSVVAIYAFSISENEISNSETQNDTKVGLQDEVEITFEPASEENEFNLTESEQQTSGRVFNFTVEDKFSISQP